MSQMKIGIFGDTDNFYRDQAFLDKYPQFKLENIPEVDMWIAVNNLTAHGYVKEVNDFITWFMSLNSKYKIIVPGSRDHSIQNVPESTILNEYIDGVDNHILIDDDCIINALHIWGTPYWCPSATMPYNLFDRAYIKESPQDLEKSWNLIPHNADIVITNTSPYSIMDDFKTTAGNVIHSGGNEDLLYRIQAVKPKLHCYSFKGNHGVKKIGDTTFVNACIVSQFNEPPQPYEIITLKY